MVAIEIHTWPIMRKRRKSQGLCHHRSMCMLFSRKQLYTLVVLHEEALVVIDVVVTTGLGPSSPLPELKINLHGTLAAPQIYPVTALSASQSHLI